MTVTAAEVHGREAEEAGNWSAVIVKSGLQSSQAAGGIDVTDFSRFTDQGDGIGIGEEEPGGVLPGRELIVPAVGVGVDGEAVVRAVIGGADEVLRGHLIHRRKRRSPFPMRGR